MNLLTRFILSRAIKRAAKKSSLINLPIATYANDYITQKIILDGWFERRELMTRAVEMAPVGGAAGGRGADPRRHPRSRSSTCQKKKNSRNRGLRPRAPPRGGTHHRNGDTFTVANGVEAPVALPGWALAPLAEVMCRESDLLSAVCLEVTTGVTRWKTKGLEPQKKT